MKKYFLPVCIIFLAACLHSKEIKVVKVQASSIQDNRPEVRGENAVDDNDRTRWGSEFSDPQWLILDLGKPEKFNTVEILWEPAYGKVYEIQASDDGKKWKTVHREDNSDGEQDIIHIVQQSARYVRFYGIERATNWGYSLFEFKIKNELIDDGKMPSKPEGIAASSMDKTVVLDWKDNSDGDFSHYNIYRAAGKGEYKKINSAPVKVSKYTDKDVKNGTRYSYYIKSADLPGNESPPSEKSAGTPGAPAGGNYFKIPQCAWMHYLGDIPEKSVSKSPDRGVAIGGFGAGAFMYNIHGSFGPFQTFDSTLYKGKWLESAAFHIYEKTGSAPAKVKCLSTDGRLKPAWDKIKTGDGIYYGLQPKGWVTYNCFGTDISQKFFSPIIANNYKETSYPVGVWQFRVYNPGKETAEVSVMLSFPGVYVGELLSETMYKNSPVKEGNITGVVLKSAKGLGEWCIASVSSESNGTSVSYAANWKGSGDGLDIWRDFSDDGILKNGNIDNSGEAAAVAVKFKLNPGESKIVPIVLAWDFPVVKFNSGTEWWKKYTEYTGRSADNSFKVAKEALNNYNDWEKKVDEWMSPVINNEKYPDWLKCTAFNELYYNQFGGIFYESGLKSGHNEEFKGLHQEDHKHFEMESPVYTSANTLDVRHYSSVIFAKFWPEIERDTLRCFADGTLYYQFPNPVPVGLVPHDVGDPRKCDPYFRFDVYRQDIPTLAYWKDLSPKYIQQCWRYYFLYKDKEFLDYVWPACKAAFGFMKSTDKDGDLLPDNSGSDNTYDSWGLYGTSLLCGGLWVGALECLEKMAEIKNDPMLNEVKGLLEKARANLDRQLWYEKEKYYMIDTKSKTPKAIMSDGLNGQLYCERYGLADILPPERMKSHMQEVYKRCVVPMKDFTGDGIGDIGALNCVGERGELIGTLQSDEVWTGATYFLAAMMYSAGLKKEALDTAYGVYYTTYINPETAFWFNTPESWRVPTMKARPDNPEQYQRPRAVWELLLAIDDPYVK